MNHFNRGLVRKVGVVIAPALLFLLFLNLVLPSARKYYVKSQLNLEAVENENVIVYAPSQELGNRVFEMFDQFRTHFFERFDGLFNPPNKRLRIHIFEDEEELSKYYERKRDKPLDRNSGFYDSSDESIAIVKSEEAKLNRAVRHEATHYFMNSGVPASSPEWSPWLSEGMASVYELFEYDPDPEKDRAWKLPQRNKWRIVGPYVQGKPLKKPIESFLTIRQSNFQQSDNRDYYYQSRLMVYFLMDQYPDAFLEYVRSEMKNGPTRPEAFVRIIGKPERIQQELSQWLREINKKMEGEIK